jgi:hypothetical protein
MKYIITEYQEMSIRKVKFFKEYLEKMLSEYTWFKGDVAIEIKNWKLRDKTYPVYKIILNTGGRSYHAYDEGSDIENNINTMFSLLFPKDEDGDSSAVWDVLFV